jgi:hypothetical protein
MPIAFISSSGDADPGDPQGEMLSNLNAASAKGAAGGMNVYVLSDVDPGIPGLDVTSDWYEFNVTAFDACLAVMEVNKQLAQSSLDYSINNTFNKLMYNQYGWYYDVDPNYGEIQKFLGLENQYAGLQPGGVWSLTSAIWQVYVYVSDDYGANWYWHQIDNSGAGDFGYEAGPNEVSEGLGLGFYRPFDDYAVDTPEFQTANVALYYQVSGGGIPIHKVKMPYNNVQGLTEVEFGDEMYKVTFTFSAKVGVFPETYIGTAIGYGSDVYAALKNCKDIVYPNPSVPVEGKDSAGPYYSWLTSVNGIANTTVPPYIPYWAFYVYENYNYASYLSGWYTPLSNGYDDGLGGLSNCSEVWLTGVLT